MTSSLKRGWILKPLIEVATLQRGYDLPVQNRNNGNVPIFAANGPVGNHNEAKVSGPGVITGRSGSIGKVHFVDSGYWPLNTALYVKDFHGNDPKFIYYLLSDFGLEKYSEGTGVPTLNRNNVHGVNVLLPPLPEQKRIAAILDKADSIRRKRQNAVRLTEELLRSVFLEMFGDPVTNPKGWERGNIEAALRNPKTDLRCGPFGTQLKVHELVSEGIPLFGIESVRDGKFNYKTSKFLTKRKAAELGSFDVKPGDVLVTRMGTIGEACVVPESVDDARISYHLFRIRTDKNKCLPEFLAATIFQSGTFLRQLKNMAHGAIMDGLSTKNIREVMFLIPPIIEQQKYVCFVKRVETLMQSQKESVDASNTFFNSILQRAFKGEL